MNNIWARTDEEDAAFRGDELRSSGLLGQLMAARILRRCEDLHEVECDACGDAHLEGVTWITQPPGAEARAYIWCPAAGRIRVERERLEVWRIDFDGLARMISSLLGLAAPQVIVTDRLWLLGSGQFGARTRDAFLARGVSWPDGRSLADSARLMTSACPVILVPNRLPNDSAWRDDGRIILSMSEFDWFGDGSQDVLRKITRVVAEYDRGAIPAHQALFHKDGTTWTLSFDETTVHVGDVVGMGYIVELLRRPGTEIEAYALVAPFREKTDTPLESQEDKITRAVAAMPGIPMTDARAIKAVKAELAKKVAELDDTPDAERPARTKLAGEISKLRDYLAQNEGRQGKPRMAGGAAQRSRSSVTHAINRAITKIAKQHLPLANHLQDSIRTGTSLAYAPAEVPNWQF